MTEGSLTKRIANTPVVSLREKSTEALTQAIHSPGDEAYAMERARVCLSCFYEADMSPEDKAAMIDEFGKALRSFPKWAVAGAFDDWMAQHHRRPSPGEIVMLTKSRVKRFTDELRYRQPPEEPAREPVDKDAAAEILARAGFDKRRTEAVQSKRMARDEAELYAEDNAERPAHWTETAAPDDPRHEELRKARAENKLIQESRDYQHAERMMGEEKSA